ncbi:MAG: hypothetical protein IJU56_10715 [Clostridia bacterium]|nr:hypothetical protein [Clostridia bacterium]
MKRIVTLTVTVLLLISMTGCSRYSSSYKAVAFVHSNEADSAFMNFYSFEGRMVFKLKSSAEGDLKYSAKLDAGNAVVYYDFYETRQELFSISGGEEIHSHGGYVESGPVYIIVETNGGCQNGEFRFSIDQ